MSFGDRSYPCDMTLTMFPRLLFCLYVCLFVFSPKELKSRRLTSLTTEVSLGIATLGQSALSLNISRKSCHAQIYSRTLQNMYGIDVSVRGKKYNNITNRNLKSVGQ